MSQNERNYAKLYAANTTALCDEAAELDTQVVGCQMVLTPSGAIIF